MRTTEFLRYLADFPSHKEIAPRLLDAAQTLEDQRLWREAWIRAENQVALLTEELNLLRSGPSHRK
jgi:hypothetical protein